MISLRGDIIALKEEINRFIEAINNNNILPEENLLKNISKNLLFQKETLLMDNSKNKYYRKAYIYNSLLIINSLNKNSILHFYQTYRTCIENFIRVVLDLKDNDDTGVNAIFKMLEENISNSTELIDIFNYIKGEYSEACNYVHSNLKADIPIALYYNEIVSSKEMDERTLKRLINKVKTLEYMLTRMLLLMYPLTVESIYSKRYEVLKFLIGDRCFKEYKVAISKVEY